MPTQNSLAGEERFNRGKVRLISFLSFILGFLDAFLLYILSSYFVQISGDQFVGSFYLISFAVVLCFLMNLQPMVQQFGSVRLLTLLLLGLIGCSFFLSLDDPSWIGAGVLLTYIVCSNLVWSVMDILLEDFSADRVSGRVRGFYLTILNLGLLLAPILSTKTLAAAGYPGVFSVLAIGYMLVLLFALLGLRHHPTPKLPKIAFLATLRRVMSRKNLLLIYIVSWTLEFFYVAMIIYTPILLRSQGFSWETIGAIFTIMLIPFVLFQYPLGIVADKKWGEKELLFVALVIMGVSTALVGFTRSTDFAVWALLLFLTRIGAAAIEVLRDSYFYKQIGPADTDIVAFFRTARPIANLFAAAVSLFFLALFSVHSLFYLVAAIAFGACGAVLLLDDTKSEAETPPSRVE